MGAQGNVVPDQVALTRGALLPWIRQRLGLPKSSDRLGRVQWLLLPLLTWAPLLVISAMQGVAVGERVRMPFLSDVAVHVRFWVSVPLLSVAGKLIDPWLTRVLKQFSDPGFIDPKDHPRLESLLSRLRPSGTSAIIEVLLLAVTYANAFLGTGLAPALTSSWRFGSPLANTWYLVVSVPIFQFLVFRWLWWFGRWSWVLSKISRLRLQLTATHPDGLGGLGVVNVGQARFGIVVFAISAVLAAEIGQRMKYGGLPLTDFKVSITGFVIASALFVVAPLVTFSPRLLATKLVGLIQYGDLAAMYTQAFQVKWIGSGGPKGPEALGSGDIQSLADMQNSFVIVRRMKILMWTQPVLLPLLVAAALPMLPLVLSEIPLNQLARMLLKAMG